MLSNYGSTGNALSAAVGMKIQCVASPVQIPRELIARKEIRTRLDAAGG
jgi:hypothetical protein